MKENYYKIGLDRVTISGLYLKITDMNKLEKCTQQVRMEKSPDAKWYGIQYLKIIDNNKFQTLTVNYLHLPVRNRELSRMVVHLDVTISNLCSEGHNLCNLTLKEYIEDLKNVYTYIEQKYGIQVQDKEAVFTKMELNCNIPLSKPYSNYVQVSELMMYNLPNSYYGNVLKEYKFIDKKTHSLFTETFSRANKCTELQMYNKSKQLKDRKKYYEFENDIMRIEIKLKTSQKIRESFSTNRINQLTDEKIIAFYHLQFEKLFIRPFYKWKDENDKLLLKKCKKNMKTKKQWINLTFRECLKEEREKNVPIIFDINQFIGIVNKLSPHHKKRNEEQIREYNLLYGNVSDDNMQLFLEIIQKEKTALDNTYRYLVSMERKIS